MGRVHEMSASIRNAYPQCPILDVYERVITESDGFQRSVVVILTADERERVLAACERASCDPDVIAGSMRAALCGTTEASALEADTGFTIEIRMVGSEMVIDVAPAWVA